MLSTIRQAIRDLFPGYFALVMATGIVSLAAHFLRMPSVAWTLFVLNNVFYMTLLILTLARLVLESRALFADLTSHAHGPGFLTLVAGTCVLGTQFAVLADWIAVATGLWFLGAGLWIVLIYTFFTSVTVRDDKPPLSKGLSGAWLLTVVSTQSVAVLGAVLAGHFGNGQEAVLFLALCLYLLGSMLYLLIITLIVYRFTFFPMAPLDLTPPYWINMGAVAITTLAGARLIQQGTAWSLLAELRPFLIGFTLFFWATATWWIPLLLILGDWRHLIRRVPLAYHPSYWAMVFPLGMYTAATLQLGQALHLPFLVEVSSYFIYLALLAWAVVFAGMVVSLGHFLAPERSKPAPEKSDPDWSSQQ